MYNIMIMLLYTLILSTNHPITMIIIIIATTMMYSISITSIMKTSWFSMILTLILIGAMLILFIYMASLSPNETFKLNKTPLLMIIPLSMIFNNIKTSEIYYTSITKLFNNIQLITMIIMAVYLLMTMITVIKITNMSNGPLRST